MNIRDVFPWQKADRKTVLLSTALLFCVVASLIVLKSARDALVLSHYPARMIPYFMLITTGAVALTTLLYLRLYKTFMLGRAVLFSLIFFAVGTSWMWHEISHGSRVLTAVLYVWVGIVSTVAPVQAWTVISQCCVSRVGRSFAAFLLLGRIRSGRGLRSCL